MGVGAARDQAEAPRQHGLGQGLRVLDDLALVGPPRRRLRLAEGHRLGRDHVHERPALDAGQHHAVEVLRMRGAAHHHAAAGAAQGLVRGGGDEVGVGHRRGVQPRRDQTGGVRDVGHEGRAHLVGDLAERLELDGAREGRAAGDDELRPVLPREVAHLVHVDALGVLADPVGHDRVELAREVHRAPRRQVAAVGEVRAQHRVARLEQGEVDRHVRLRARVRLHVDVLGPEELLAARDGQLLGDVHDLAAAVVALARVALGVLVGEDRAHRLQHRLGDEVLGRDQLEVARLPLGLAADRLGDLGVHLLDEPGSRPSVPSAWRRCSSVGDLAHPARVAVAREGRSRARSGGSRARGRGR